MRKQGVQRGLTLWLAILAAIAPSAGCRPEASDRADVKVAVTLDPSPPVVGNAGLSLMLTGAGGAPLAGAQVRVEGNMNHAGMKPSFADLVEVEPGQYAGVLDFTMGGDWFLLATADLPDGSSVNRKIDVPGVQAR